MVRRDKVIRSRVTDAERKTLLRKAKKMGMTISDYIRFAAIESDNLNITVIDTAPLKKLGYELTKQGVNLNQYMKFLNTYGGHAHNAEEAERILGREGDVFLRVMEALGDLKREAERHRVYILDEEDDGDDRQQ